MYVFYSCMQSYMYVHTYLKKVDFVQKANIYIPIYARVRLCVYIPCVCEYICV